MSKYKRGFIIRNGKKYGFYPDGSLYRIYEDDERPFIAFVDNDGETIMQVRQATELGYAEVPVWGCADLSYPTSALRRSRTVGGADWSMLSLVVIS